MDIRATGKDYIILHKLYNAYDNVNKDVVTLSEDASAVVPVIMVKTDTGALAEWTRGMANVSSFIKYGYVRIIKKCPYQFGKCRGEKCQLYVVHNGTGDCAHNWTAINTMRS